MNFLRVILLLILPLLVSTSLTFGAPRSKSRPARDADSTTTVASVEAMAVSGAGTPFSATTPQAQEWLAQARAAQAEGKLSEALQIGQRLTKRYPNTVAAAEGHRIRGQVFAQRNQFEKSARELVTILNNYPQYEDFNGVVGEVEDLGARVLAGERPRYFGLIPGFRDRLLGVSLFEAIVSYAPQSDLAPPALIAVAALWEKEGKPENAIEALDRLINRYPRSVQTEEAYLQLARLYSEFVQGPAYDQAATRASIRYYEDFLVIHPRSAEVPAAEAKLAEMRNTLANNRYLMGRFFYFYRNMHDAARIFLNDAITVAPDSPTADDAREILARIERGEDAPKTPVDWLFGRYKHPVQYRLEKPDTATEAGAEGAGSL